MKSLFVASIALLPFLASCSDVMDEMNQKAENLSIDVRTVVIESRGLIESAILPDGHSIGISLTDRGGTKYDGVTYHNIEAQASTGKTPQVWTLKSDILLSSTDGTLHAYYPYSSSVTDMTQIAVTAGETDWMYAEPVSDVHNGNSEVSVMFNHALAAVRVNIIRGSYMGPGKISSVGVRGDNMAHSGILDACAGALSGHSRVGEAFEWNVDMTITKDRQKTELIFVPLVGIAAQPVFTVVMDGQRYTVNCSELEFEQGHVYDYVLTANGQGMSLSGVKVDGWKFNDSGDGVIDSGHEIILGGNTEDIAFNVHKGDGLVTVKAVPVKENQSVRPLELPDGVATQVKDERGGLTVVIETGSLMQNLVLEFNGCVQYVDLNTAPDGVYAVAKNGLGVTVDDADADCVAVALVAQEAAVPQKILIEKNETINPAYNDNTLVCWNYNCDDLTLANYLNVNGANSYGYLPKPDGTYIGKPELSADYDAWVAGSLSDFNGKSNTSVLAVHSDRDKDMYQVLESFNAADDQNLGYSDWYIPACGQLALIYLNIEQVNVMIQKIEGERFAGRDYWSSSEYGANFGWYVSFSNGFIYNDTKCSYSRRVRFVRDI